MSRAVVLGPDCALTDAACGAVEQMGFDIARQLDDGEADPASLLLTVLPRGSADRLGHLVEEAWRDAFDKGLSDLVLSIDAFARQMPASARDGTGEQHAMGSVIHLVDHPLEVAVTSHLSTAVAAASIAAITRIAALQLAPQLRVNTIVPACRQTGTRGTGGEVANTLDLPRLPKDASALTPTFEHLIKMPAITGQIISLQPHGD